MERRREYILVRSMSSGENCDIRWRYCFVAGFCHRRLENMAIAYYGMLSFRHACSTTSNAFARFKEPCHASPAYIQQTCEKDRQRHFVMDSRYQISHDRTLALLFMRRHAHLLKRLWSLTWFARSFRRRLCHSPCRLRRSCRRRKCRSVSQSDRFPARNFSAWRSRWSRPRS